MLFSCEDIEQENLEGTKANLISPGNNFVSPNGSIEFIWEDLEGAENYRIQIAQPTFDSLALLILDSTTVSTSYSFELSPGDYEWRVRGENNFSMGEYASRFISIDSSLVLTGTSVILNSPLDNSYSNADSVNFSWAALTNANNYSFQISNDLGETVVEEFLSGTSISANLSEGIYEWAVQGINDNSVSLLSTRSLTIDRSNPSTPLLTFPSLNFTLPADTSFSFNWTSGSDASPTADSLFIFNEGTNPFTTLFAEEAQSGITWESANLGTGQYSWQVRTYDAAGNLSNYSNLNLFSVNP
ncbi:MAG: hypothetical protein AAF487_04670 [Bacteroidota bacterium]